VVDGEDEQKARASAKCARLNLVDLAGSERIAHTGAAGTRLKEGAFINKSLFALTSVITKLTSNNPKEKMHIPYRNSKLTRILQPSLGGNAKTSIICNVTAYHKHFDETLSTFKFASSAKAIKNKPKVNMMDTQKADVYKETIKALEERLAAAEAKNDKMDQLNKLLVYVPISYFCILISRFVFSTLTCEFTLVYYDRHPNATLKTK
jgi:hypothetical protein